MRGRKFMTYMLCCLQAIKSMIPITELISAKIQMTHTYCSITMPHIAHSYAQADIIFTNESQVNIAANTDDAHSHALR